MSLQKHTINVVHVALLFFLFSFIPTDAFAGSASPPYYKDPEAIMKAISQKGADNVVEELYENHIIWDSVLGNIATGKTEWLEAATALWPGSDAHTAESLIHALGEALEKKPENVLRYALKGFGLEFVCSAPDVDDPRYDSYELALAGIERRMSKVSGIRATKFKTQKKICLESLERSKKGIACFYEIEKNCYQD